MGQRRDTDRGGLARLLDRLLGRRARPRPAEATPLFTAQQPPPSTGPSAAAGQDEPGAPARTDGPAPDDRAPALFADRPRQDESRPSTQVRPRPVEDERDLQPSVNEDLLDRATPRPRTAPDVRVHDQHVEDRSGPVRLTPSQAIELARGGPEALRRRDRQR